MNIKSAQQKGHLSIVALLIIISLILAGAAYFYYKSIYKEYDEVIFKTNDSASDLVLIDTSDWQTYPTKGSYTGWTLKHPTEYTPLGVEAEYRIYIESINKEDVMVSLRNNSYSTGTLKESVESRQKADSCLISGGIAAVTVNGSNGFMYTSSCEDVLKTTYIIENPYIKKELVEIRYYVKNTATIQQKSVGQKIIQTVSFVEPEEPLEEGYSAFYNVNLDFSLKYPEKYTNETDSTTGWPNANLVLYSGGQSYDLIVQIWNSEAEYKNAFADNPAALDNITVKKVKDKYVTFLNLNDSQEVTAIINTFSILE